jgi:hypothetical protein
MSKMTDYIQYINEFVASNRDTLHLSELSHEERKEIHAYVKDNFSKKYISRSEYIATGMEVLCCDSWHKSSEYGKCWNGGSIFCDKCSQITYTEYDNYEDVMDCDDIRLSNYKPSGKIMICKKGYPYKRGYGCPFSYRKHY